MQTNYISGMIVTPDASGYIYLPVRCQLCAGPSHEHDIVVDGKHYHVGCFSNDPIFPIRRVVLAREQQLLAL